MQGFLRARHTHTQTQVCVRISRQLKLRYISLGAVKSIGKTDDGRSGLLLLYTTTTLNEAL